jgi:hypothetical protein
VAHDEGSITDDAFLAHRGHGGAMRPAPLRLGAASVRLAFRDVARRASGRSAEPVIDRQDKLFPEH